MFRDARPFDSLHLSRCRLSSCVSVKKTHKTIKKKGQPSNMYVEKFIFSSERFKLILRDIKLKLRWLWSCRRVVIVVYGFTTPLRRQEMMIKSPNSSSFIVDLSWQNCVGWLSGMVKSRSSCISLSTRS